MKVDKMVPKVYYKESRDFSYIGRIFEIALNYSKTCADIVNKDPDSDQINPMIIDLLSTTLGFESKHKYITKDLIAIASTLIEILRYKGTERSIETCVRALSASQGVSQELYSLPSIEDKYDWTLILPPNLKDTTLLKDLFDYILPAGTCISLLKASEVNLPVDYLSIIDSIPTVLSTSNEELSKIVNANTRFIKDSEYVNQEQSLIAPSTIEGENEKDPSLTYFGTVFTPRNSDNYSEEDPKKVIRDSE